ncbi:hypothetical protein [Paraglaciecola sp. L3A3]|uniref:hypothetical protein n=1 Tax=Paraglaciecola sp. L3A3 TaxID=2686358 RepID=UPI00131B7A6C|nr:hypothetical protein [Paraglaciecola sp. L3A3]
MKTLAIRHAYFIVFLFLSMPTYAFKIGTHIWLAEHIAQDVIDDGELQFIDINDNEFDSIEVNWQLAESIKKHKNIFIFGTLGPDLYPDLVAGQMTTHPGLPFAQLNSLGQEINCTDDAKKECASLPKELTEIMRLTGLKLTGDKWGWQTDDWLRHVRTQAYAVTPRGQPSKEIAFAYGYLLHAAMDTWAHSYVNVITGDLFSLSENQAIAARHAGLEGYWNNLHPQHYEMFNSRFNRKPTHQESLMWFADFGAPKEFVRNTLILNEKTAWQHARSAGALHIWAMWAFWETAKNSQRNLEPIKKQLNISMNRSIKLVDDAEALWRTAEASKKSAVKIFTTAYSNMKTAETDMQNAAADLAKHTDNVMAYIASAPAIKYALAQANGVLNHVIALLPAHMQTNLNHARNQKLTATTAFNVMNTIYQSQKSKRDTAINKATKALTEFNLQKQTLATLTQARDISLKQLDDASKTWQRNIENGVDAYIAAYEEVGRSLLRPQTNRFEVGSSAPEALTHWASCWIPAFAPTSINTQFISQACHSGLIKYSDFNQTLTTLKQNVLLPTPLRKTIIEFDEQIHDQMVHHLPLIGELIRKALPKLDKGEVVPSSADFFARLWDHDITQDELTTLYSKDNSEKQLLTFNAENNELLEILIKDGLKIPKEGHKNSYQSMFKFTPIRNAVTLSKLSLLTSNQLNGLIKKKTRRKNLYDSTRVNKAWRGDPYVAGQPAGDVLIGAIRSIDGNHQWLSVAPMLPRDLHTGVKTIKPRATEKACRRFGYPQKNNYPNVRDLNIEASEKSKDCSSSEQFSSRIDIKPNDALGGFRIWQDTRLRSVVFNKLFKGPISTGMCGLLKVRSSSASKEQILQYDIQREGLGCNNENYPAAPVKSNVLQKTMQIIMR